MYELEDIFESLTRAGYDVSAARQDFQLLSQFVSQCIDAAGGLSASYDSSIKSQPNGKSTSFTPSRKPPHSVQGSSHVPSSSSKRSSSKHVHFASHATVYAHGQESFRSVFTPPMRPSCLPRGPRHEPTYAHTFSSFVSGFSNPPSSY